MKKTIAFSLLFIFSIVTAYANQAKIIAVVNGEIITNMDLNKEMEAYKISNNIDEASSHVQREVLDTLIDNKLIELEANKQGIKISDDDLESELRNFIAQSQLPEAEFYAQATLQGLNKAMLKDRIKLNIIRQGLFTQMVERKVVVTRGEVEQYYNEHKDEFASASNKIRISLIIYPAGFDYENTSEDVKKGKMKFEDIAKKYSIGPNAIDGGDLGYVQYADLNYDIQRMVTSLQVGEVSDVFSMQLNKAQIKLVDSVGDDNFEESYAYIEKIIREPRLQSRLVDYMEQLRNKAVIDVRL